MLPLFGAVAQHPSFPALADPTPRTKLKKLARLPSDHWQVDGLTTEYSWIAGGFFTTAPQQHVFLQRYPETDDVIAHIPWHESRGRAQAHGPATFRSPDGLAFTQGHYADGVATGTWTRTTIDTVIDVASTCPALLLGILSTDLHAQLRECFGDSPVYSRISVTSATLRDGKLSGPYRTRTLSGKPRYQAIYERDALVGEESVYDYRDDSLNLRITHRAGVADTGYQRRRSIPMSEDLHEQMPAFPCDCPQPPHLSVATSQEVAAYQRCAQTAMLEYIYQAVRYPASARRLGITGTAIVTFVVEKDGSLSGIRTPRFVSASIDAEARRVVAAMPPWQPGYQRGKPVRVQFNLPIAFRLE